jgi:hypothetical protein
MGLTPGRVLLLMEALNGSAPSGGDRLGDGPCGGGPIPVLDESVTTGVAVGGLLILAGSVLASSRARQPGTADPWTPPRSRAP